MSFREFIDKKSSGIQVEMLIDEFRENLLADLSKAVYTNQEQIKDFIAESVDLEKIKIFCDSIKYPESLEFEISIKSKKVKKIIEHLENLESFFCKKNKTLDLIKNQIFEYVLNIQNNTLESRNIDCIIENRILNLKKILFQIESKIKKTRLLDSHKISLKPEYCFEKLDSEKININVDEGKEATFSCIIKNGQFNFENLSLFTQNEKLRSEINLLFETLKSNKEINLYKTFYFEWPKQRRIEIDRIKTRICWGILESLPLQVVLKEEIPQNSQNDIWKMKIKSDKTTETVVWIERISGE